MSAVAKSVAHDELLALLQEARRRFDAAEEARKRERAEQVEAEERRKREIYLNGGYLDCTNAGECVDVGNPLKVESNSF